MRKSDHSGTVHGRDPPHITGVTDAQRTLDEPLIPPSQARRAIAVGEWPARPSLRSSSSFKLGSASPDSSVTRSTAITIA